MLREKHESMPSVPPPTAERPRLCPVSRAGDLVITAGQTAHVNGKLIAIGVVGREVTLDIARQCAWQCARNVIAALIKGGVELDQIRGVHRVTVFVAAAPDFYDVHLVADAATEYLHMLFGEAGQHTRAAIGVAALPGGSPVEVEAQFIVGS